MWCSGRATDTVIVVKRESSPSWKPALLYSARRKHWEYEGSITSTVYTVDRIMHHRRAGLTMSVMRGKSSALLTATKHGKGRLNKAMRYFLDSDSTPDKCTDPVWLPGMHHPSYEPPSPVAASPMLLRSGSVNSKRAASSALRHSPQSLHCQWQRRTLLIALVIQKPRRTLAGRIICGFHVTRLDHISLPLLPHSRPVTYCPQTRAGQGHCSRRPNAADIL